MSLDLEEEHDKIALTRFLCKCDILFEKSTYADKLIGGYGTRGVISIDERLGLQGNFAVPYDRNLYIDKESAMKIMTADKIRFSSPPSIMMNMAFAKSYLLESSGKLLKEPSLYVQDNLLTEDKIQFVSPNWQNHGSIEFNKEIFTVVRKDSEGE